MNFRRLIVHPPLEGENAAKVSTVWLTLEQIQLVAILLLFGAGLLLRKSLTRT